MKEKKKVRKTSTKKEEEHKKKNKWSDYLLLWVFLFLLLLVVFLFGMVLKKSKEMKNKVEADLVIPVFKKDTKSGFTLNVSNLKDKKDYILKVTNTKNNKINSKEFTYNISFENKTGAEIEITKNDGVENLITNQEKTVIENQKLTKDVEHSVYYHIRVISASNISKDDKIEIIVES